MKSVWINFWKILNKTIIMTDWETAPLYWPNYCVTTGTKPWKHKCCGQVLVCQVWWSSTGLPEIFTFSLCTWLWKVLYCLICKKQTNKTNMHLWYDHWFFNSKHNFLAPTLLAFARIEQKIIVLCIIVYHMIDSLHCELSFQKNTKTKVPENLQRPTTSFC